MDNLGNYDSSGENIVYVNALEHIRGEKLLFATKQGMLKQVDGSEFDASKRTIAATKLADEDKLISVKIAGTCTQIVLQTVSGVFLRFALEEVPEKKKGAIGVRGIKLLKGDSLEHVYFLQEGQDTDVQYKEKHVQLNRLKIGKRDTKGCKIRL